MRFIVAGMLLVLTGCTLGQAQLKHQPLFEGDQLVETRPLPEDPSKADRSKFPGSDTQVAPLSKGEQAPFDGIIESEHKAELFGLYQVRYTQLSQIYQVDRSQWAAQRAAYEGTLAQDEEKIRKLEPGWFEQHAFQLGFIGGVLLTAVATLAVGVSLK